MYQANFSNSSQAERKSEASRRGETRHESGQGLLAIKVVAAFRGVVNVPGHLLQLIESREEIRGLAEGRNQALDHLLAGKSLDGVHRGGEAGSKKQRTNLGRGLLPGLKIHDLGVS